MKDENYCTIGGRVTHDPGIYSTANQGHLLSFSVAHHSNFPSDNTPLFFEVKVSGNDRTKLDEFSKRLPKGRKVTVHNAELQIKKWKPADSEDEKVSYHLFCRMDQIYLQDLPKKAALAA